VCTVSHQRVWVSYALWWQRRGGSDRHTGEHTLPIPPRSLFADPENTDCEPFAAVEARGLWLKQSVTAVEGDCTS
jgi:hypothetical protein